MRANSLTNLGVALDYNVSSDYDKVLVVAGLASEIEELAPHANEIANLVANLPDVLTVQEASELVNNLTVKVTTLPAGSAATSELVGTEIRLGIPAGTQGVQGLQGPKGDKGDKGDIGLTGAQGPIGLTGPQGPRGLRGNDGVDGVGVEITSILNNPNKSLTINFSDGTQHTTDPLKGQDGTSVTVTNVVNNANGTMQINFSDGTSHTTADLTGPRGFKGDTGDHVHHISYQRSKDSLGNEIGPVTPSQSGYTDTYAMWASQEELPEMYIGEFTVYNGLNTLSAEDQAKFDSVEFGATADQEAFEVVYDSSVSGLVADNVQEAIDNLSATTIKTAEKGQPDGVATLDSNGKILLVQIADSILGQLEYMGVHNFNTMPTATEKGQYWIANVSGNGYEVGDWAVWNGVSFDKVDNTDAVSSVAGRTGNVVLNKNDVGLSNVDNIADANKNVLSATKLTTARTITLSGDISGSASVDGSADVTITTTVQPNSVELGTDTTGDYMVNVAAGSGISVSHTQGEGSTATITNSAPNVTTNITTTHTSTKVDVNSSDGTDGTINSATQTLAGVMSAADKTKLDGIEAGATGDQTASEILTLLKTVDGSGSGLEADLLDGQEGAYYLNASNISTGTINDAHLPDTITSDIAGNAATATKLATARIISLTGDVTGNVNFDGSANVSITTTVADDSHNHVISNVDGLQAALDSKANQSTTYTKTEVDNALALKVDDTEIASVNLLRADKYLAAQNVVNMSYNLNGKLEKVQYNNATDVDYEVLTYNVDGKLSNVAHYVGGVLQGNTVLSYSNGKLIAAPYTAI